MHEEYLERAASLKAHNEMEAAMRAERKAIRHAAWKKGRRAIGWKLVEVTNKVFAKCHAQRRLVNIRGKMKNVDEITTADMM